MTASKSSSSDAANSAPSGEPMVDHVPGSRGVRFVGSGSCIYTAIGANAMNSTPGAANA